ncbi:ABC transporter permease [Chelatococcus asaccharovorans]|uniref:NitT/TauT family transport system permease protein/sulfonate transport system permease protein n=1 Tax=Chelatococcus asaccharovorans TaxID=28210 RepID=A0A2V3U0K1_9HYPH|nr:ABC transporter permease [Chelatococcus asaccharovorans]MBS7707801.1 ABC transporter permease [Chelatococcus asaccharovorans]PXW55099.1 NitT/TauT family transport system permease protein/sulfonate transport system permease protein [Chelatococcus asaccharovorans]
MSLHLRLRPFILPLLLLALWQIAAMAYAQTSRMPVPGDVLTMGWTLVSSGELPLALLQSLKRVLLGFACAASLALVVGTAMAAFEPIGRNLDPIVESFRPIAPIALLPLAILWFGTGTPAAAFIVGYAAFFPMLVNTIHGVRSIDQGVIRAARTLGVSRFTILRTVVLPGALPNLFVGARLALGVAWTSIIAAELAVGAKAGGGGSGGIGQMMFVFYAYSVDLSGIIVCMIGVGLVALIIDRGVRALEFWMLPWKR